MESYFLSICLIAVGSAFLAWAACRFRQPILIGYFLCGVILGHQCLDLVTDTHLLREISHIGITLLLFLAGLVLHPDRFLKYFKIATVVTVGGAAISCMMVFAYLFLAGYTAVESLVVGLALMFSSTILVIKLLPTTTLHQRHMGSICIAVLIAQDVLAVIAIMFVGLKPEESIWQFILLLNLKVLLLIIAAMIFERYIMRRMMQSVDRYTEVLLMLCLGWCMGIAALAHYFGISYEIGAFIAGIIMARSKIAYVISEKLQPMRDFFLMFFFFVLGAGFDFTKMEGIWPYAIVLGALIICLRPVCMKYLMQFMGEQKRFSTEMGFRLGQASEFALILAFAAEESGRLTLATVHLIQVTTIITMIISSYIIVFKYPTPIGTLEKLKKD